MKTAFLFLLAWAALCGLSYSAFYFENLSITITVQEDGSTSVQEQVSLTVTTPASVSLYRSILSKNDLGTINEFLNLSEIRYHVSGASVGIRDARVRAVQPFECSEVGAQVQSCRAAIFIDYLTYPINPNPENGTGLFSIQKYKPRSTKYSLNPRALTISGSGEGTLVVNRFTILNFLIPKQAKNVQMQPKQASLFEQESEQGRLYSISNQVLPEFAFSFEVEQSLEREVLESFSLSQKSVQGAIFGPQGLAIIAIAGIIIASYVYINFVARKNRQGG